MDVCPPSSTLEPVQPHQLHHQQQQHHQQQNNGSGSLPDRRAMQIAVELSKLQLATAATSSSTSSQSVSSPSSSKRCSIGTTSPGTAFHSIYSTARGCSPPPAPPPPLAPAQTSSAHSQRYQNCMDCRPAKSCNMTECVHVPSSEHVAEIVGRQGLYHPTPPPTRPH